jgi:hypothetical protein
MAFMDRLIRVFASEKRDPSTRSLENTVRFHPNAADSLYIALPLLILTISCADVVAQTPSSGRQFGLQPGESRGLLSKDTFGKPCLDIEAVGRAHVSNPQIYDHIVSVVNQCLKPLKVRVCYFGSDRCTELNVPAMKRKDIIIGVGPKIFRYSYSEKP